MKVKMCVAFFGALWLVSGCVNTVNDRSTFGVPGIKDSIEGRYERSPEAILRAAKEVVSSMGVLNNEGIIYGSPSTVRTVEGKVNQRSVWIRIEPVDSKITRVVVETRTRGGGSDIDLAHQIEKEIALKLVR